MTKLSVIVPVYNTEKYLRQCLDSLVNQTLSDIEIIAIDDCSTDKSLDILKQYAVDYPNINLYINEKNMGLSVTRNMGIDLATGDYIGFVDSDDFVNPEMYYNLYFGAVLKNYPPIVSSGIETFHNEKFIGINEKQGSKAKYLEMKKNNKHFCFESASCCDKIFRSDFLENERFLPNKIWEDIAFTYTLMTKAQNILSFDRLDYYYRKGTGGITSSNLKVNPRLLEIFDITSHLEERTKQLGTYNDFEVAIKGIEIESCLQRVTEISRWNVEEPIKTDLIENIGELTYLYFGDWENINQTTRQVRLNSTVLKKYNLENGPSKVTNRTKDEIKTHIKKYI